MSTSEESVTLSESGATTSSSATPAASRTPITVDALLGTIRLAVQSEVANALSSSHTPSSGASGTSTSGVVVPPASPSGMQVAMIIHTRIQLLFRYIWVVPIMSLACVGTGVYGYGAKLHEYVVSPPPQLVG